MKKIIAILLIIVLTLTMCTPVFAQNNEDLFYYDYSKTGLEERMKDELEIKYRDREILEYFEEICHMDATEVDLTKMEYRTEETYAFRRWTVDNFVGFLKADNKKEYLESIDIKYFVHPCYYDGKKQYKHWAKITYFDYCDLWGYTGLSANTNDYTNSGANKEHVQAELEADGITGYTVIQTANIMGCIFAALYKDNEYFAVCLVDTEKTTFMSSSAALTYEKHKELFKKRVFSVEEMETIANTYNSFEKEWLENNTSDITNDGGSMPDQPESLKPIDESQNTDVKQPEQQVTNNEQTKPTTDNVETPKIDAQTQIAEPETITTGSNVETVTPEKLEVEDDDLQKSEFPYWIIGVIVGVIAIAAVAVIVIKKKKA